MILEDALNNILGQIKRELNKEPARTDELTGATYYRLDSNGEKYNRSALLLSGFVVYASYTGVISFTSPYSYEDVKMDISSSGFIKMQELLQLWIDIENTCKSIIDSPAYIISTIINQNLGSFRSLKNDTIIEKWCVQHLFFSVGVSSWQRYVHDDEIRSYLHIMNTVCSKALGLPDSLNFKDNSVLITVNNLEYIQSIFLEHKSAKITFYGCKECELDIRTNILLLPSYNHYQWVDYPHHYMLDKAGEIWEPKGRDMVFCFDVPEGFDAIVSASQWYEELKFDDLMYFLKPNGNVIAFGISAKKSDLSKDFFYYHVPFVLSHYMRKEQLAIICIKEKDVTQRVYVADVIYDDVYGVSLSAKETSEIICRGGFDTYVQPLNKSDFKYCDTEIITYYSIKRDEDKLDYVWREKTEILAISDNEECLHEDIDLNKIISSSAFHKLSEFDVKLSESFSQESVLQNKVGSNQLVKEFDIGFSPDKTHIRVNGIPSKYVSMMRPILGISGEQTDEIKQFEAKICCRLLTRRMWLTNSASSKLVLVDASIENPYCYRLFHFYLDEYQQWGIIDDLHTVTINDEYDENYIAYFIQKTKRNVLLIPPTKEEQNTIYTKIYQEHIREEQAHEKIKNRAISDINHSLKFVLGCQVDFREKVSDYLQEMDPSSDFVQSIKGLIGTSGYIERYIKRGGVDFAEEGDGVFESINICKELREYVNFWNLTKVLPFSIEFVTNGLDFIEIDLDSTRFLIMLDALLENAKTHSFNERTNSKDNLFRIEISTVSIDKVNYLLIAVRNNGKPFPPDMNAKRYITRGESSKKHESKCGIGGYQIGTIVHQHKGRLHVDNKNKNLVDNKKWTVKIDILFPITKQYNIKCQEYEYAKECI